VPTGGRSSGARAHTHPSLSDRCRAGQLMKRLGGRKPPKRFENSRRFRCNSVFSPCRPWAPWLDPCRGPWMVEPAHPALKRGATIVTPLPGRSARNRRSARSPCDEKMITRPMERSRQGPDSRRNGPGRDLIIVANPALKRGAAIVTPLPGRSARNRRSARSTCDEK
jgi:hypothetical protein